MKFHISLKLALWGIILGGVLGVTFRTDLALAHEYERKPIQIDHLNLDYMSKTGRGFVQELSYHIDDMSLLHQNLAARLQMKEKTLSITDGTTTFSVHNILDFINRFDKISAQNLNFHFVNSKFTGWIDQADLSLAQGLSTSSAQKASVLAKDFKATCGNDLSNIPMNEDTLLFIFNMCFNEGRVEMSSAEFSFQSQTSQFLEALQQQMVEEFVPVSVPQKDVLPKPKINFIHNFNLNLDKNRYDLSFRLKMWIDLKLLLRGHVEFIPSLTASAAEGIFKVRIDDAKAGIFGIKKAIFKALQQLQIPDLKIEPPYLYLKYRAVTHKTP